MNGLQFTRLQDSMADEQDYVELGLSCADVCQALERGLKVGRVNELCESMLGAIEKLTAWVEPGMCASKNPLTKVYHRTVSAIQNKIVKQGKRNPISRLLHAGSNRNAIVAWGRDLDRILHIFNVRSVSLAWQFLRASGSDGTVNE